MSKKAKEYQKLATPEGLDLKKHFFIRDTGDPKTCYEMYIFVCIDDHGAELPNGWNCYPGDIVQASAHVSENYNSVGWSITRPHDPNFWQWLGRVLIKDAGKYETFEEFNQNI